MARVNRSTEFWLEQVIFWGDRLSHHCEELSLSEFGSDLRAIDAVSWCIGCIGEACGTILRIDPDFATRNPQLELTTAYAARNRFVHGYFDLDTEQMWVTAKISVPGLVSEARSILSVRK